MMNIICQYLNISKTVNTAITVKFHARKIAFRSFQTLEVKVSDRVSTDTANERR